MNDNEKLLLENYKILHESVQNSHKHSWTLTSIFVPIIFGSIAFLFKYSEDITIPFFIIITLGIIFTILFWIQAIRFLENCNKLRFHQLQRIEKAIATLTKDKMDVEFTYYNLFAPKEKNKIVKRWIKYKSIINGFALAIVFLLIVNMVVKLSLYFMAN